MTVAGHINEGDDLFAQAHRSADVREGDIVAMSTSAATTRR